MGNFFALLFENVLEARKSLQSWSSVELLPFTMINIPHSLPVSMSVFLYIQMSPKPPYKKIKLSPIPPTKNYWTHTHIFFKLHPKKGFSFGNGVYIRIGQESLCPRMEDF